MSGSGDEMTFWDHLDVLRGTLFRSALAVLCTGVLLMCFKGFLFDDVILAPTKSGFWLYKWLGLPFSMSLINTEISAQFFIHLKVSFICGFVISFPYDCVFNDYGNIDMMNGFDETEHRRLAADFRNLPCRALMVIGKTPLTMELYGDYVFDEYYKNYAVNIKNRFNNDKMHIVVKNY